MHDMHRRWSPGRVGAVMLLASGLIPGFAVRGAERDPWAPLQNIERALPQPLPGHPGNVFLAEESVVVPVAAEGTWTRYRVLDDAGETVGGGARPADRLAQLHDPTPRIIFSLAKKPFLWIMK